MIGLPWRAPCTRQAAQTPGVTGAWFDVGMRRSLAALTLLASGCSAHFVGEGTSPTQTSDPALLTGSEVLWLLIGGLLLAAALIAVVPRLVQWLVNRPTAPPDVTQETFKRAIDPD